MNRFFLFLIAIHIYPTLVSAIELNNEITDTLVLKSSKYLYSRPNFNSKIKTIKVQRGEFVFPVDKKIIPEEGGNGQYSFMRITTKNSDTGFILAGSLMSLVDYKLKTDSITYFKSIKQPSLDSMRGKPCLDTSHVNNEVELIFPWNYLDKKSNYATISASNRYNLNFRYLLLVSSPDTANIILDIIPVNLTDLPKGTEIDFGNCSRGNVSYDTSGLISLLYTDPDKYKPGKQVKPFKSWKADLKTKRINEISVQDINCRQQDPEEMFNGP